MSNQQQFEQMLKSMMSEDNKTRKQAETMFNKTRKTQPNPILQALLQVGRTATDPDLRSFALIVLRRSLIDGERSMWPKLNVQTQTLIKRELLAGVEQDEDAVVRANLREAAFDVASDLFDDNKPWNEIIDWILKIAQSSVAHHRESALTLVGQLSIYMVDAFKHENNFRIIFELLAGGFKDNDNLAVRLAALTAATNIIQVFTDAGPRAKLRELTPLMLETIAAALRAEELDSAQSAIKMFIELVDLDPGFIKPNAQMVTDAMVQVARAENLDDSIRQLAIEFLVTLAENKPQMCRELPNFAKNVIEVLLAMMMEIEDASVAEWNAALKGAETGDDAALDILNNEIAQEALDRIAVALEGDVVAPVIFEHVPKLLAVTDNWKARHVGLMSMSMIFEGASDTLLTHLDKIVAMVLPCFEDSNPRVRWAALNAVGQMATDFGPKLQRLYHKDLVPRIVKLLDDNANPKVVAHACAATINFCEKVERVTLEQYLPLYLPALYKTMQSSNKVVQEQAITAVASLAGAAGNAFTPFYDNFMPALKEVMIKVTSKDLRMLRCKAIECVSLIGVAVGKQRFLSDSGHVMDVLAKINTAQLDADDMQREFILQAWTRIASTLGSDFVPFLKFVMPQVFEAASNEAGVKILDIGEDDEELEEQEGWELINIGDKAIAIHTSALEEKATACNMLFCYAQEMKSGFVPYVEKSIEILVPLLDYFYHDGVRMSAMSAVPHLINSVKLFREEQKQDQSETVRLFQHLFEPLVTAVKKENDTEVIVVGVECIHETLDIIGDGILSADQVKELVRVVKSFFLASQKRREDFLKDNPDGDADDTRVAREEIGKEDDVLHELAEVVGVLVREYPDFFLQAYDELHELCMAMIKNDRPRAERQFAICVFDDIVENTKEKSHQLFQFYLPFLLQYSQDPHRGLRQACTYGLGVCVQFGPKEFDSAVPQVLEALVKVINAPNSREGLNAPPAENAISSFVKIILYRPHVVGDKVNEMIDAFVNWLPAEVDLAECKVLHRFLIQFLKSHSAVVFGPNYKNLPKLLHIFARLLETDLVYQETASDIYAFLAQMQQALPGDLLKAAFEAISQDDQTKLQRKPNVSASPPSTPQK